VNEEITIIERDVSQSGLATTLLQEGQPGTFVFMGLTQTEQEYAQIEKNKCLLVVFACNSLTGIYMDVM